MLDETFGLGPLEPLMRDPTITRHPGQRAEGASTSSGRGGWSRSDIAFNDERHLVADRPADRRPGRPAGGRDQPDGRRPAARRQPRQRHHSAPGAGRRAAVDPAVRHPAASGSTTWSTYKAITREMVDFLSACVKARVNMVISGGTGSGKTTLLNALSAFIPEDERVATIEDAAELRLQQPHVVRMETRPANIEGEGEVTTRDLVKNALRMRPDRIIVGECRGAEALDMLQAMNTGHDGSMTTIHANDTRDAIGRMEMMVGMAGFDLPIWIIRRQIASAIQIRRPGGPALRRRPQGHQDLGDHRHGGRRDQHAGHLRLQADGRGRTTGSPRAISSRTGLAAAMPGTAGDLRRRAAGRDVRAPGLERVNSPEPGPRRADRLTRTPTCGGQAVTPTPSFHC